MDRRTLLAVALSFMVFVIWTNLFAPKPLPPEPEPPVAPATEGDTPPAVSGTPSLGTAEPQMSFAEPTDATESPVVVETPLYRAEFQPRGGALVSLVPHAYTLEEDVPLELVISDTPQPELAIDTDGDGPAPPVSLSNTLFQTQTRSGSTGEVEEVVFTATSENGGRIERRYRIDPERFAIEMTTRVSGIGAEDGRAIWAWTAGMPITEAYTKQDLDEFAALIRVGDTIERKPLRDFAGVDNDIPYEGTVRWAASRTKYFMSALFLTNGDADHALLFGDAEGNRIGFQIAAPVLGGGTTATQMLYVGPLEQDKLVALGDGIDKKVGIATMPLGSVFGWFAKLIYQAMLALYAVIPNYGVAIILLAVITKALFFPLTRKSAQSMKAMAELRPHMEAVREKHKDDPQKMNMEMIGLYKKHGVNPVSGCLPLLFQLPIFWALYGVLRSAIELRGAPFVAWINDLSAPDTLMTLGSVPFFPDQLHVLPILMAITTVLMQKKTITDPRQKSLMYMMPVIMLFFFYNLPSGLNLYWTVQNLLVWVEQSITRSNVTPATAKAA